MCCFWWRSLSQSRIDENPTRYSIDIQLIQRLLMHYTLCLNRVMVCSFKVPVKMFSFIFLSQIYKYSKKDFRNLFYYNESKTKNKYQRRNRLNRWKKNYLSFLHISYTNVSYGHDVHCIPSIYVSCTWKSVPLDHLPPILPPLIIHLW